MSLVSMPLTGTDEGSDNVVYTGAEGIQSVLSSFYADLFSKETDLTVQASLLSNVSDRVPTDLVGDCEGLLSVAECFAAVGYGEG